jgi:uncharacterized membrane protein YkvA (DUF1232 family)
VKAVKDWVERVKRETVTLWFCMRHPRTPLLAKALAAGLVAYAFSPIDLIPDFIPVLGLLDDLLILPLGMWLVIKLVPDDVIAECRGEAARWIEERRPKPRSNAGAALVIACWLALLALLGWLAWRWTVA